MRRMFLKLWQLMLWAALLVMPLRSVQADDETQLKFFEQKIRPVLVDRCYKCHSSDSDDPSGGLRLDSAEGMRRGGELGPAVVPGDPKESLLLSAIQYENLEMPPEEKLPEDVIADFRQWIRQGAADSRTTEIPPADSPTTQSKTIGSPADTPPIHDKSGSALSRATKPSADPATCSACVMLMPHQDQTSVTASPIHCWPNWVAGVLLNSRH